jgi:hypothetical protein
MLTPSAPNDSIGGMRQHPNVSIDGIVEEKQGLIIDSQMAEPWITLSQEQEAVIQILKRAQQLPRNIKVKSKKIRKVLDPITSNLGISLRIGPLPLLEEAKASLRSYLSGHSTQRRDKSFGAKGFSQDE